LFLIAALLIFGILFFPEVIIDSVISSKKDCLMASEDGWTSRRLSMVFLNIDGEKEYLDDIINVLDGSKRIHVLNRESWRSRLIDLIIVSSSKLNEPTTAYIVGKKLCAKLITTGSIKREKNYWLINLRLIDSENTLKPPIEWSIKKNNREEMLSNISKSIVDKIRYLYPLKGKIDLVKKFEATINIGADIGMVEGLKMKVMSDKNDIVGEIEVDLIEKKSPLPEYILIR
jgi:TolB-like protein